MQEEVITLTELVENAPAPFMVAEGEWKNEYDEFDIDRDDILSYLVEATGKYCKRNHYQIYDHWKVIEMMFDMKHYSGGHYIFGFHENGVDTRREIAFLLQMHTPLEHYKEILMVRIITGDLKMKIELSQLYGENKK